MFTKLFSTITESSLWSEPKEVRLLFVTMLAKADQNGFVEASIPGLARVANLTVEETQAGLECLSSPDVYSKNPDNEGRRILAVPGGFMLLNYEEYRARRSTEERREYMREYMKDYRKKSKQSVNNRKQSLATVNHSKPRLAQAETEAEAEAEKKKNLSAPSSGRKGYPEQFEQFWSSFPKRRRTKKGDAFAAWKRAVKVAEMDYLTARAADYSKSDKGSGEYAVMPSVWLNSQMWDDEDEAWSDAKPEHKPQKQLVGRPPTPAHDYDGNGGWYVRWPEKLPSDWRANN